MNKPIFPLIKHIYAHKYSYFEWITLALAFAGHMYRYIIISLKAYRNVPVVFTYFSKQQNSGQSSKQVMDRGNSLARGCRNLDK